MCSLDEFMGGGDAKFKKISKKLDELIKIRVFFWLRIIFQNIKYCNKALLLDRGRLIEYDIVKDAIEEHKKLLSN